MTKQITIAIEHFREYRQKLGFSNQTDVKNFFGAKNITPTVDFAYISLLNERLECIVNKINGVVAEEIKSDNLIAFKKEYIGNTFEIMKENQMFPILNNQGRRPEQVYFS